MRILYITPYVPSPIRVRPYELLRALCALGVRPTVLCAASAADEPAIAELRGWGLDVVAAPVGAMQRVLATARGALVGQPLQAAYGVPAVFIRRLRELLATRRFDLVHIEHLRAAALLPLVRPLPVIYDAVDCISLLLERTRAAGLDWRSRSIAALELGRTRAFERAVCTEAQLTLVTSPEDARALRTIASDARIRVVPNGVDGARFAPATAGRSEQMIVCTGKMSYHANVAAAHRLITRIMPLVWASRPDAQLWIVGSAPPRSIRRYTADPRVVVTGHVPAIAPYLQRATVAASPLCYGVGVQNKVLEAMATATPTVTDRQCLAALEAQPGREILVADDDRSFAAALVQLLSDAALRERIGAAGQAYVAQSHRWTASAQMLLDGYRQVLHGRSVPPLPSVAGLGSAVPEPRRQV